MALTGSEDLSADGHGRPGWRRVAWEGEIDAATAPAMLARTLRGTEDGSHVGVDLATVQFMDAAGLGALVTARSRLRSQGGDLRVYNAPSLVRRLIALFELADLIQPRTQDCPPRSDLDPPGDEMSVPPPYRSAS